MSKTQVILIHGGDTFDTYEEYISFLKSFPFDINYFKNKRWKSTFQEKLGSDFEVIAPRMPNENNAKYLEWKIFFEKLIPQFENEIIIIGHSLGGIFVAKYLSENKLPKKVRAVFLIAPPFDNVDLEGSLADFDLFSDLSLFEKQTGEIYLYHSKDDPVVPVSAVEKYKKKISKMHVKILNNRGHLNQEEFPELVEDVKNLLKSA